MATTKHRERRNALNEERPFAPGPSEAFKYEDRQMFFTAAELARRAARGMYLEAPEFELQQTGQVAAEASVAALAMTAHNQAQDTLISTLGQGAVWNGGNVAQAEPSLVQSNQDYLNAIGEHRFQPPAQQIAKGFEDLGLVVGGPGGYN